MQDCLTIGHFLWHLMWSTGRRFIAVTVDDAKNSQADQDNEIQA